MKHHLVFVLQLLDTALRMAGKSTTVATIYEVITIRDEQQTNKNLGP